MSVQLSVQDNQLGAVPAGATRTPLIIGVCSSGVANQVYSFGDVATLVRTLGHGPAVELAAHVLANGGGPVLVARVTPSTAGAAGSVSKSGTGPDVTVTGAPYDSYDVRVRITRGGVPGVAAFRLSLDGGLTEEPETVIPADGTYEVPNSGLTLEFEVEVGGEEPETAVYVAGDTYSFTTTEPSYDASTFTTAFADILKDSRDWAWMHVANRFASASAAATFAAALGAAAETARTSQQRYVFGVMDANDTDANLSSAFQSFAHARVVVGAGTARLISAVSGRIYVRPAGWTLSARLAQTPPSESAAFVGRGPLSGIVSLVRDEYQTPGLSAQRFVVLTTYPGLQGFFVADDQTMAPVGSDYALLPNRRVMDRACQVAYSALLRQKSAKLDTKADGTLADTAAIAVESAIESPLRTALVATDDASAVSVAVNRSENVLASKNVTVSIAVRPKAYAKTITATIGFASPQAE